MHCNTKAKLSFQTQSRFLPLVHFIFQCEFVVGVTDQWSRGSLVLVMSVLRASVLIDGDTCDPSSCKPFFFFI